MNALDNIWFRGLLTAGLLFGAQGCETIEGSGRAASEQREVPSFSHVLVRAGLRADVRPGPQSVVVTGDDNIVPHVMTNVRGSVLTIEPELDFDPVVPLSISVSAPELNGASLEAGGRLDVSELDAEAFSLELNAGGKIVASGRVRHLDVSLSAGGTLDATAIASPTVTLWSSAGGSVLVTALEEVSGAIESGSEAWIYGSPARRNVSTKSGGEVSYLE